MKHTRATVYGALMISAALYITGSSPSLAAGIDCTKVASSLASGEKVYDLPSIEISSIDVHMVHVRKFVAREVTLSGDSASLHVIRANTPDEVITGPYKITFITDHCVVAPGEPVPLILSDIKPYIVP